METLHDVKRQLKAAKEDYNAQRANLDVQARDKALKEMLKKQRTLERMQFIRAIIDFDLPQNAVALQPTNKYFCARWPMEDKELAGVPVPKAERATVQRYKEEAEEALKRCHNAFYDAVDKAHAETVAKEHALGVASSPPREVKPRYDVPKRVAPPPRQADPIQPGGFADLVCVFLAMCFLIACGYGAYWVIQKLLTYT